MKDYVKFEIEVIDFTEKDAEVAGSGDSFYDS